MCCILQCKISRMARTGHAGAIRRRLLLRVERTCRASRDTSEFDPTRKSLAPTAQLPQTMISALPVPAQELTGEGVYKMKPGAGWTSNRLISSIGGFLLLMQ